MTNTHKTILFSLAVHDAYKKNVLLHYTATTLPLQKAVQKSKLNLENTKVSITSANIMLN